MVALVTGGASGLGRATAARFAKKGTKVVICDLPKSNGDEIATEIGENVTYIPADVRSPQNIQDLMKTIQTKFGQLDLVVNCAGIQRSAETYNFLQGVPNSMEDFELIFNVNQTFYLSSRSIRNQYFFFLLKFFRQKFLARLM